MAQLLDGKKVSKTFRDEIGEEVKAWIELGGKRPHLAAILVGEDGASQTYVNNKVKACEEVGFTSTLRVFPPSITEEELLIEVEKINENSDIDGLIVQLPLPKHISVERVTEKIKPEKDVDGFHPVNVGRMVKNIPAYISATPFGIVKLLEKYNIETSGKNCVVIGRSDIVGTPVSILLSRKGFPGDATVTLCHSRSQNIEEFTKEADIIVVALGIPEYLKGNMVKEGVVVIDVGITRVEDSLSKKGYSLKGDVDFKEVSEKASFITPVPGGVGPMTIASLLYNTLLSAKKIVFK